MNSNVDHEYYYYLYSGYLRNIIRKCKSVHFDPLNSYATEDLDKAHAYLRRYWFDENINKVWMNELMDLFEEAVLVFKPIYVKYSGFAPGNIDGYLSLITLCKTCEGE